MRYDGEFLILLPHSDLEQSEKALLRLRDTLAKHPFSHNENSCRYLQRGPNHPQAG